MTRSLYGLPFHGRVAWFVRVLTVQLVEKKQYGVDGDSRIDYSRPLPRPFTSRPRLSTRLFVRGNARRIMKPLLKELRTLLCLALVITGGYVVVIVRRLMVVKSMECCCRSSVLMGASSVVVHLLLPCVARSDDWIADTRGKAITLLCTVLVYLEEHITQDVRDWAIEWDRGVCTRIIEVV